MVHAIDHHDSALRMQKRQEKKRNNKLIKMLSNRCCSSSTQLHNGTAAAGGDLWGCERLRLWLSLCLWRWLRLWRGLQCAHKLYIKIKIIFMNRNASQAKPSQAKRERMPKGRRCLQFISILTCAWPCWAKATGALRPATTPVGSFMRPVGWMAAPFQLSGWVGWYSGAPNGGKAVPGPNSGGSLNGTRLCV